MATVTAVFTKDEDKKHSIRFKEADTVDPIIGTLYVKRSALADLGTPDGDRPLIVTVEVE